MGENMVTGLPDYTRGVSIDAVTVSEVPINIKAQTLEKVAVDIIAQSVGNLNVNIAAQTATLDVNITASTATVDVNITNASIDVNVTNSTLTVTVDSGVINIDRGFIAEFTKMPTGVLVKKYYCASPYVNMLLTEDKLLQKDTYLGPNSTNSTSYVKLIEARFRLPVTWNNCKLPSNSYYFGKCRIGLWIDNTSAYAYAYVRVSIGKIADSSETEFDYTTTDEVSTNSTSEVQYDLTFDNKLTSEYTLSSGEELYVKFEVYAKTNSDLYYAHVKFSFDSQNEDTYVFLPFTAIL